MQEHAPIDGADVPAVPIQPATNDAPELYEVLVTQPARDRIQFEGRELSIRQKEGDGFLRSADLGVDVGWTTAGSCAFRYDVQDGRLLLSDIWVVLRGRHREQAKLGEGPPIMGALPDVGRGSFTRYRLTRPMTSTGALLCAGDHRRALVAQDGVIELFFDGGQLTGSLDHSERIAALRTTATGPFVARDDLRAGLRGRYWAPNAMDFEAMAAQVDAEQGGAAGAKGKSDTPWAILEDKIRRRRAEDQHDGEPDA